MHQFVREVYLTLAFTALAGTVAFVTARLLGCGRLALGAWCVIEVLFFAVQRLRYHRLNRVNRERPSAHNIDERFAHFLTLAGGPGGEPVLDIREFISGWFLHMPFSQIREGNVADFIAYSYWYRPRAELSAEESATVYEYTRRMADAWGVVFPPGCNEQLRLMGHLWEPLKVFHKPLFVHLASEGSMFVTHLALQGMGFVRYECMGFTYWARGLGDPDLTRTPAADGRVSALESALRDLGSLVAGDDEDAAVRRGPLDLLASLSMPQLQTFSEYQQRLEAALAAVRPHLTRHLPSLPDLPGPASLSRHFPSVSDLSRLPSFRDLDSFPEFGDLRAEGLTGRIAAARARFPSLPTISDLSQLPGFRDLDSLGGSFDDVGAAAREAHGGLPALRATLTGAASMRVSAARAAMQAALPLLNLPDWHMPFSVPRAVTQGTEAGRLQEAGARVFDTAAAAPGSRGGMAPWQRKLTAAASAVMDSVELDGLFGRMAAAEDDGCPRSGLVQAWIDSARAALEARAWSPAVCGFALPSPAQLLARAHIGSIDALHPADAAALRQTVEGAVLDRAGPSPRTASASSASSVASSRRSGCRSEARTAMSFAPATVLQAAHSERSAPCTQRTDVAAVPSALPVPSYSSRSEGAAATQACGPHQAGPADAAPPPIVFLHGVGFGVFPYLGFVSKLLRAFAGRPFVLLEVRHVSLRLCMRAMGVDDVVRVLSEVLQRHAVPAANFVGHSFGTFVIAHMRKLYPEAVASVCLCDPVCMLTCFPKLLYNFIYRGVTLRDVIDNPAEAARWIAARDLIIAATFCRHFWWHTLMLWPWELPEPSVLVLSGKDALVPSELVRKQLAGAPPYVHVLERPDLYHGHFLFRPAWQDVIVAKFREVVLDKEARNGCAECRSNIQGC